MIKTELAIGHPYQVNKWLNVTLVDIEKNNKVRVIPHTGHPSHDEEVIHTIVLDSRRLKPLEPAKKTSRP